MQVDKPELEPESDQGDGSSDHKTPKYKVGTFIIKEMDDILCTGVIHRVIFENKSFVYSVKLTEVDFEECCFCIRWIDCDKGPGCFC